MFFLLLGCARAWVQGSRHGSLELLSVSMNSSSASVVSLCTFFSPSILRYQDLCRALSHYVTARCTPWVRGSPYNSNQGSGAIDPLGSPSFLSCVGFRPVPLRIAKSVEIGLYSTDRHTGYIFVCELAHTHKRPKNHDSLHRAANFGEFYAAKPTYVLSPT